MTTQVYPQNTIAVIWDFDDTLTPRSMQSPIFEKYEVDEREFWREVNELSHYYADRKINVTQSSAYLNHILTYVQDGQLAGLNNKILEELGGEIEFFEGVLEFFEYLKNDVLVENAFRKYDITVELYVVSTGLRRMINGSKLSQYIDGVWGCEFIENAAPPGYLNNGQRHLLPENTQISQIGCLIDDTIKTRPIFEINKGSNKNPNVDVNSQIPHEHRRVPFRNMIYVADGPSDIPVFSLLKQLNGRTYAVYHPESERHFDRVYNLRRQDRIEAYGPADYSKNSQTWLWVVSTVKDIAGRIVQAKEYALASTVQQPPGHVESSSPLNGIPQSTDGGLLEQDTPLV